MASKSLAWAFYITLVLALLRLAFVKGSGHDITALDMYCVWAVWIIAWIRTWVDGVVRSFEVTREQRKAEFYIIQSVIAMAIIGMWFLIRSLRMLN